MPGIPVNQFVGLSESSAADLLCGICFHVAYEAVDIGCGHHYCSDCIHRIQRQYNPFNSFLHTNRLVCPACGHKLVWDRHHTSHQFPPINQRIHDMVSQLTIKCRFAANGCPRVMPLHSLAAHLEVCPFSPCGKCGSKCKGAVPKYRPHKVFGGRDHQHRSIYGRNY